MALCDAQRERAVRFAYFVDEVDAAPDPDEVVTLASPDESPTAWVILNRRPLVMTAEEDLAAHPERVGWGQGSTAEHWMGCPLFDSQHQVIGAIVIQSYSPKHHYSIEDQSLFNLLAGHVSNALQGMQSMDRLEKAVHERTAMLEQRNLALREAQSELVRQEKLASLGRLVAGVAHEINTPLGICVTATSHLVQELKLTREELASDTMTAESLAMFLDIVDQSLRIMTTNTQRAANLVRSFKQVAVDQSSDDLRSFNLNKYIHEVLLSLQPKLKGRPVKVSVQCEPDITMESFPGAVSQILTNMVVNSLVHGFEHEQPGAIVISAALDGETVVFHYADDGAGMDADTLSKLVRPLLHHPARQRRQRPGRAYPVQPGDRAAGRDGEGGQRAGRGFEVCVAVSAQQKAGAARRCGRIAKGGLAQARSATMPVPFLESKQTQKLWFAKNGTGTLRCQSPC